MADQAPIIISMFPRDVRLFLDYMEELRGKGTVLMAQSESERLNTYFNGLSVQLGADINATQEQSLNLAALTHEKSLSQLFNVVAQSTGNTLLSEVIIGPEGLIKRRDTLKDNKLFNGPSPYNGHAINFGFIQTFEKDGKGSVVVTMLTLDSAMMRNVEHHEPQSMMRAMQAIATASNHDMLHHYTNLVVNDVIAETRSDESLPKPPTTTDDWFGRYFAERKKDSDIISYESWSVLNHAHTRRRMEAGPEGKIMKKNCDLFCDELARIGLEIAEKYSVETAHETVDYFGTVFLHAMMRSMPLNHPLIDHVIKRLQKADPKSALVEAKKQEIIADAMSGKAYMGDALANYKAAGIDLLPDNIGYTELKKLQMMLITPWIAHLLSPAQPDTPLAAMQARVSQVNIDMIKNTAASFWFNPVDGVHFIDLPDNKVAEVHFKNGVLHREDGPAFIKRSPDGPDEQEWYRDGKKIEATIQPSQKPTVSAKPFRP